MPAPLKERDLARELEALFTADGIWRTYKEAAANKGGIGANEKDVEATLDGTPDRFVRLDSGMCRSQRICKAVDT